MDNSEQPSEMTHPALQYLMADVSELILGLDDWPESHEVHLHLHDARLALESDHLESIYTSMRQLRYWKDRLTAMRDQA